MTTAFRWGKLGWKSHLGGLNKMPISSYAKFDLRKAFRKGKNLLRLEDTKFEMRNVNDWKFRGRKRWVVGDGNNLLWNLAKILENDKSEHITTENENLEYEQELNSSQWILLKFHTVALFLFKIFVETLRNMDKVAYSQRVSCCVSLTLDPLLYKSLSLHINH
jgi:hypothetical protein